MHAGKYLPGLIAAFAALPAHAQQTSPTPTPSPTRPPVTILPAIVPERFSIGPPTQTPTPVPTPTPTPAPTAAAPTPRAAPPAQARRAPAPVPQVVATQTPVPVARPVIAPSATPSAAPLQPQVIAAPAPAAPSNSQPWLWALLGAGVTAAIGLAGWLLLRRRRPEEEEPAPLPAAPAAPIPPVRGPSPRITLPKPAAAAEPFDIVVQPVRIEIGEREVRIGIELLIANTSGAAADGVRVAAAAISASPNQDAQIAAFRAGSQMAQTGDAFDLAAGAGGRLPVQLVLAREALHVVDLGGRPMFVPIVAIDLRWRSGLSIRRFGASFMLGGAGPSGKPGPIWLDRGQPRGPFAASRYAPPA